MACNCTQKTSPTGFGQITTSTQDQMRANEAQYSGPAVVAPAGLGKTPPPPAPKTAAAKVPRKTRRSSSSSSSS